MEVFVSLRQKIISVVSLFVLDIIFVDSQHWDRLHSEALPSHGLYTEPTLRDVSFTLAKLTWTVYEIRETNLVSVELFVKRLSKTGDILWKPLPELSFSHPVTANSTHAIRFERNLNVIHGEAYRATVNLTSTTKNTTLTTDVTTVPRGPKSVNLIILEAKRIRAVAATFGGNRIDAVYGHFETPDGKVTGTVGRISLDHPRFTESEVWIDTPLAFSLVPGQTYRTVVYSSSWSRQSETYTGSNFRTIAPVAPVIEEVHRLSNTSIRVTWMLSTGMADIFIVAVNRRKHVMLGDNYVTSVGRYSADISGMKSAPSYFITVTAESNRTQGPESLTYTTTDDFFPDDSELDKMPFSDAKSADDGSGDVIVPWVISGVLALIVLCLAVTLGLTIRKLRQSGTTLKKVDNPQALPAYDSGGYLHPL